MDSGPSRRSHSVRVSLYACALLVLVAPVARGAVDLRTEAFILVLAGIAALCLVVRFPFVSYPTLALVAVLAWMSVQVLPVPVPAHAASPGAVSVFGVSLAELGRYPGPRPFALDVPSGQREVAKASACLLLVLVSSGFAATRRRRLVLSGALAASSALVAAIALGSALAGFGPLLASSIPFVNANHLAGFLNLTGFVALGLALEAQTREWRIAWAACFAVIAVAVVSSLSRAGIVVFVLGLLVFAFWVRRRTLLPSRTRLALVLSSVGAGLTAGALLAFVPLLQQIGALRATPASLKMELWPLGLRLVREYVLTGIGRGAFPTVLQAYRSDMVPVVFTHIENEWLQAIIDLGVPFGVLMLGTLLWVWVRAARRATSIAEIGMLVGMLCLGLHSVFDFSLEVLGVAVPFSVSLGLAMASARRIQVPRTVLLSLVAAISLMGLLRMHWWSQADDRLSGLAFAPIGQTTALGIRVAVERPADYLPHALVGARLAQAHRCGEALPWLRRAMLLAPMVPEPHAFAGRCLAGGPQDALALREYVLAFALGYTPALAEAMAFWPSLDDLYRIAGQTPDGLLALAYALSATRAVDAQLVFTRLWTEFLDDRATLPLARVALRNRDFDTALRAARAHQRVAPGDPEGYKVAGWALEASGSLPSAREEVGKGLHLVPGSAELVSVLAAWDIRERRFSDARRLAGQIAPTSPQRLAARHGLLARILIAQSRVPEAIVELEAAAVATPDDPQLLVTLAALCEQVGRVPEAVAALEHAAVLPGAPIHEIAIGLERLRRATTPGDSAPPAGAERTSP